MRQALVGRRHEQKVLDDLLRDLETGTSRVLVLRGAAGAGKTALLDHLVEHASAARVVRASGVEQESEIAYSALQHLCAPLMPGLDALPAVQRNAISVAFGLSAGAPPEPLLLGMAVLGLFADAASKVALVCVVDDVQWLDRHSALILGFVARRLAAEGVALVLALRSPSDGSVWAGLPELWVGGLAAPDARRLLDSVLTGPVDAAVRERIVSETQGNPLALLELPHDLDAAELSFGLGNRPPPMAGRVEDGFARRIAALPQDTRTLLLAAAVEPLGDVHLLEDALRHLGVDLAASAPAEADGLVELHPQVRFRHPLVRSAAWRSADPAVLRRVHAALAAAVDPARDPDRHAWHRAHATVLPDEDVADELARSAERAMARGGQAAAAAFLERAASLTPDPARRAGRALAAARARLDAGSPALVPDLLAAAELGPLDALQRASAARLRAQLTYVLNPGLGAGPPLLEAAARLEPLDATAARETYLAALGAALWAGRLAPPGELPRTAAAAASMAPAEDVPGLFLQGLVAWGLDDRPAAVGLLSRALRSITTDEDLRLLWLASIVAMELYDLDAWIRVTGQAIRFARTTGTLSVLPAAVSYRAGALVFAGRLAEAVNLQDEAAAAGRATGVETYLATGAVLAAHQGRESVAAEVIAGLERDARDRGVGRLLGVAAYTRAVLNNGLGQYAAALEAARGATEHADISIHHWSLSELVEAASRVGDLESASRARRRLEDWTSIVRTPWADGAQALADALCDPSASAEHRYREAVAHFERGHVGMQAARARLLLGEWLRRENRRVDARHELRLAHAAFASMGCEAFAARAGRELMATGETVRKRVPDGQEELTAQEAQVARLAAAGRTNPEIGAALFLSPRTVEWHLRKVFAKLGITSRRELARVLRSS